MLVRYANFKDAIFWCERNRQPAAARVVFKHTRHLMFYRCAPLIYRKTFMDDEPNICSAARAGCIAVDAHQSSNLRVG